MFRVVAEDEALRGLGPSEYLGSCGGRWPAFRGFPRESAVRDRGEPRDVRYGYPAMAHAARDDGFDAIAAWFEALAKTEWLHAKRFKDLLASIVEMKC